MPRGDGFAKPRQKRAAHRRTINSRYAGANSYEQRSLPAPPSTPAGSRRLVANGLSGAFSQDFARGP
jgi:hypothetical protein